MKTSRREQYLLKVIERIVYNTGLGSLQKVSEISEDFKIKVEDKPQGPRLVLHQL